MRVLIASSALAAMLLGAPTMATAQVGPGDYCLKKSSGAANCLYASMAQCEQAKTSQQDQCLPKSETTGAGSPSGSAPATGDRMPPSRR